MAHAKLIFVENEEYDFKGWKLTRHPTFFPVEAAGVAHDLIEHAPRDRGRVIEEMRAQGAFVFTRVQSGRLYRSYAGSMTLGEILGSTILSTFREAVSGGYTGSHLKEKASRWKLSEWEEYEEAFCEALRYVREHWEEEVGHDDAAIAHGASFFSGHGEAVILTAMRAGFRWAQHRYGDPYRACTLFDRIEAAVEKITPEAELGDEIVVHYGLQSLQVRVNQLSPYYR